jgi:glutathione peroxidase
MAHAFAALSLKDLNGKPLATSAYANKALLVVNVASKCGLTPQYTDLVALHKELAAQGGAVLGVPCNQFGKQEPGTPEEIATFCSTTYGVDFPLLAKQDVNGKGRSPLYKHLVESGVGGGSDLSWNFEKFVVDKNGKVIARFAPTTKPRASEIMAALAQALG